jgi:hypothetical protein
MTMNADQFIDILERVAEPRSYSGRGMFGKSCVGVVADDPFSLLSEITQEILRDDMLSLDVTMPLMTEWLEIMANTTTDSMGFSTIIYWPSIAWPIDREDTSDNTEDE